MKIVKFEERLIKEEKEVIFLLDEVSKTWNLDTTILKYYNKAKKQGWKQLVEYVYDDGTVCGGVFEAPDYAVTIRSATRKQMSEKQMQNLNSL